MSKPDSLVSILLDENNEEPIVLTSDTGRTIKYDQVAVIPMEGKLYAILKPLDRIKGISDDQAILFYVDENNDRLEIVQDMSVLEKVYKIYMNLLENKGD